MIMANRVASLMRADPKLVTTANRQYLERLLEQEGINNCSTAERLRRLNEAAGALGITCPENRSAKGSSLYLFFLQLLHTMRRALLIEELELTENTRVILKNGLGSGPIRRITDTLYLEIPGQEMPWSPAMVERVVR